YKHVMTEVLHLSPPELAVLCVLMIRGSQTVGEIRGSAARLHEFSGLEEVEATLNSLISREPDRLVARLPRQPGQKEARFAHLLSGEVPSEVFSQAERQPETIPRSSAADRISKLESEVETLKAEVEKLREQF